MGLPRRLPAFRGDNGGMNQNYLDRRGASKVEWNKSGFSLKEQGIS
jgi:hypothetical protein